MVQIDKLTKQIEARDKRVAAATEAARQADEKERDNAASKTHRALQRKMAIELPALQAAFDEQAARIYPLISERMWASQATIVKFPKTSWRQFRSPKYPVLMLGTASGRDSRMFQMYRVSCRADGILLYCEAMFSEYGYSSSLSRAFERGGRKDCEVILDFLRNYKP